jgi:hypothetical protein
MVTNNFSEDLWDLRSDDGNSNSSVTFCLPHVVCQLSFSNYSSGHPTECWRHETEGMAVRIVDLVHIDSLKSNITRPGQEVPPCSPFISSGQVMNARNLRTHPR